MLRFSLCVFLMGVCAAGASGEVFWISSSTATDGDTDVVMNDCYVDTNGAQWLSSLFACELSSGEFYQIADTGGPWVYDPENPVDSWLAPEVSYYGNADDFAMQYLGMADTTNLAASITMISDLVGGEIPAWDDVAARFTFTDNAQGVWAFKVSMKGSSPVVYTGTVQDGFMVIPEPGCFVLLTGLLGLALGRRRK